MHKDRRVCVLCTAVLLAVAGLSPFVAAQEQPAAPTAAPTTLPPAPGSARTRQPDAEQEKPQPSIFEEGLSDAELIERIGQAAARAARRNKRVLLVWGNNTSKFCRLLDKRLTTDSAVAAKMNGEYERVMIDVGALGDQHAALAQLYGANVHDDGVPQLTILDTSLAPLARQTSEPLENKYQHMNPGYSSSALIEWFIANQTARPDAERLAADAFDNAKKNDKNVLMYFRENGCHWCDKLEDWLDREDVRAILEKDLVIVGIDTDRMTQGPDVATRFVGGLADSPPWMLIMDADQHPLATANMPTDATLSGTQNIGFPQADDERAYFAEMLKKSRKRMSDEEIEQIKESLKPKR